MSKYFLAIMLVVLGSFAFTPEAAYSQNPPTNIELGGYAWSGYNDGSGLTGVGWISMSCENDNSCFDPVSNPSGIDYGVTLNTDGTLTDYAWSPNIGWIKFGGLSDFPATAQVFNSNAQMTGDYNISLTARGWARACAATINTDCSVMTDAPATTAGGWDGWISLGDLSGAYNLTTNATGFTAGSYAWGGSIVMGWIDFSRVTFGATPPPVTTPTISSFTADPVEVTVGNTSNLTYNVTNVTSCTASHVNSNGRTDTVWYSGLSLSVDAGDHTETVTPELGTTVYTLECTDGSTTVTEDVTVEARANIIIGSISTTEGTLNGIGEYDTVAFAAQVAGIPNGQSVNYIVEFGSLTDKTGTIVGTGVNNSVPLSVTFDDVPYTTGPSVTFRVDTSPAPAGAVLENIAATNPINEDDNTRTGTASLTFPPPTVTFTGDPVVRSGETTDIDWVIDAPYNMTCNINPGTTPASITFLAGGVPNTGTATSNALLNSTTFELSCDAGGGNVFPYTHQVEVIPSFEEV